jgi:hypothetical protein
MAWQRPALSLLLALSTITCSHCVSSARSRTVAHAKEATIGSDAIADDPDAVVSAADVDTISVTRVAGSQQRLILRITGLLHDGATQIQKISQQRVGNVIMVRVTTMRPKNSVARVALIPFERTVELDTAGMPKGEFVVTVNTLQTTAVLR